MGESAWLIGVWAIVLGLDLVRYMNPIETSRFNVAIGATARAAEMSDYAGIELLLIPPLIVVVGATTTSSARRRMDRSQG